MLAEMKRLNIVKGVVSGGSGDRIAAAIRWKEAAPDRIIAGAGIRGSRTRRFPRSTCCARPFRTAASRPRRSHRGLRRRDTR